MFRFILVLPVFAYLSTLLYYLNTPYQNEEVHKIRDELLKQRTRLISYDYEKIALQPCRTVQRTLTEYKNVLEFTQARFSTFKENIKDDPYLSAINELLPIVRDINILVNNLMESIDKLNVNYSYVINEMLNVMENNINDLLNLLKVSGEEIESINNQLVNSKNLVLSVEWNAAFVFQDPSNAEFVNVFKPLKLVFIDMVEALERILEGLTNVCGKENVFVGRLKLILEVIDEWRNDCK